MQHQLQFKSRKIDVTPDFPCRLFGMKDDDSSEGIYSKLEVNTMIFHDGSNTTFVTSIDTLFVSKELKSAISNLINEQFGGTDEKNVVIVSSHTHYAPSLEVKRVKLGKKDDRYFEFLTSKIKTLFEELKVESFQHVTLKSAEGESRDLTCSRRRRARLIRSYFNPIITMEPNPDGFKNEEFKILNVCDANNDELLGVIWSFPCHPTNFPDSTLISSEFPGIIRDSIRSNTSPNASVLYFPGMAGDVRAYPPKRRSIEKFVRRILNLSYKLSHFRFADTTEYLSWTKSLTKAFFEINGTQKEVQLTNSNLDSSLIKHPLEDLGIKADGVPEVIFRRFSIGDYFAIYSVSAEPVSYYSKVFEANSDENFTIYTGYTDEVFGYLPTHKQVLEGGYESEGYFDWFLIEGSFLKSIESTVGARIKSLCDGSKVRH